MKTSKPNLNQSPKQVLQRKQEMLNQNINTVLPPDVEGNNYGHLFIEIGDLHWLIYNGENYLDQEVGSSSKGVENLFINFKFWGDRTKGIFLKFANGMKKKEIVTNKFKYDIKCPEKSFEKYLDDMGVLVIDFFDLKKNQNIGTSKIILKLFIKRAKSQNDDTPLLELRGTFPISLTGNPNVKIGEFSLSMISSFTDPFQVRGLEKKEMNLEDSFIENEKLAEQISKKEKDQKIIEKAFGDERIPASLQNRQKTEQTYNKTDFDIEIDQRPTRDRSNKIAKITGKENQRSLINIDENEDTYHNQEAFEKIFSRGEKLKKQMDEALTKDQAWETLHGNFEVPKQYVPPFMQKQEENQQEQELDSLYALELEGNNNLQDEQQNQEQNKADNQISQTSENAQLRDMKFIKIKIKSLKVENEELNQKLIDNFNLVVEIPLADIYQKKITYQTLKLNNYDIVSFNEFLFNSLTLYNFKIDEETFNQLVQAQIRVNIEGQDVYGNLMMNRVLLAKNYKLEASIPLEKRFLIEDKFSKTKGKESKTKTKNPNKNKIQTKKKIGQVIQQQQQEEGQYTSKTVAHLTLEINLQRGDNEEEMQRNYQMKLLKLQEQKALEEEERKLEAQRKMKFSMNQEPVFAQLYINIDKIRNMINDQVKPLQQDDSFNLRQDETKMTQAISPKKNIFIRYKAFPSLEKNQTQIIFAETEPKFNYKAQFPLIMTPDILEKFEKFSFILEVWDATSPSREELIGIVKIPLSSFCYSMQTTDSKVFSLNFLADQHSLYPMMIVDDFLPIYSPKQGMNVGQLKVTLALGSPLQINRYIQKEQIQGQAQMEKELAEKLRQQEELRRQRQQERISSPERQKTPERSLIIQEQEKSPILNMVNFFRQSLNISGGVSRDLDMRSMTFLHCLRKLFEEARACNIQEINGEEVIKDSHKNFDGSVKKDVFISAILSKTEFTLTRTEITNISSLLLNINRNDNDNIDIDELQFSYRSYLKYYEILESRIMDLLEKFKLSITKKIDDQQQLEAFIKQIEDRSIESKLTIDDFKSLMENNGIEIREALYDQFSSYFDLDRNDSVYIKSFCEYLRNSSMKNFNFFKVNPAIITNQICEFIKNSIETNKDSLDILEREFKIELHKAQGKSGNIEDIPTGILQGERINSKIFLFKLKKQGIALSLWEVFTLFEHLNITYAKIFYEPQRYQFITYGLFYKFITGQEYDQKIQQEAKRVKASIESVFALAQDLNKEQKNIIEKSEEGIYSNKSELEESEGEVIITKDKYKQSLKKKEMTFLDKDSEDQHFQRMKQFDFVDEDQPYKQVKHIFEIKVKELRNIPILDKLIREVCSYEQAATSQIKTASEKKQQEKDSNKYIQNAAIKYGFPLDEEEILESDYLQLNKENLDQKSTYDYKVSMDAVHTYILGKEEKIQKLLRKNQSDQIFNISLVLYEEGKEYVVGNAQLPIEDIMELIENYEAKVGNYNDLTNQSSLSRILFIYGTTYSQRENCIIGKMLIEINYMTQKILLSKEEQKQYSQDDKENISQECFMHRETYINRKIPLNAVISVQIEKIQNLKESINNIEHFSKIQQSVILEQEETKMLKSVTGKSSKPQQLGQQAERKRVLTSIFKQGLNLCVFTHLFAGDQELIERFPNSNNHTRVLFNTLNPIFNEGFELNIQMDTQIFDYIKRNKAIFEIRHYITNTQKEQQDINGISSLLQSDQQLQSQRSQISENENQFIEKSDYIVLGYVKIPLLSLITKNNGIDGEFVILDEYKQQMGTLKLKISLNHHNYKRPLYSTTNKIPAQIYQREADINKTTMIEKTLTLQNSLARGKHIYDSQYLLGINFVELIIKDRNNLFQQLGSSYDSQSFLYLKFRLKGQNFQTKFYSQSSSLQSQFLRKLDLRIFDISKTIFIDIDFSKQREIEEYFAKPLEIQLWYKKESKMRYQQAEKEQLLGSFFIELNDVSKIKNKRIREMNGIMQGYEGYFSLFDYDKEQVGQDRLGAKLYLFKKGKQISILKYIIEYDTQISDIEVLFHNLRNTENIIESRLDPQSKGYVDLDDLKQLIQREFQDPYLSMMNSYIENLEYKSSEKVYYSPLFGLPSPFFKYAKRFDQFGIIEKFQKELIALDNYENGFVPTALFRSVLEHELKIKEVIVIDFIQNMKEHDNQTLDVNVISHSLKTHIDYIVLLRKLCLYFELKHQREESEKLIPSIKGLQDENEGILKVQIESVMRLKNPLNELEPPNSFVVLRSPFYMSNPALIKTNTVRKSSYPAFHIEQALKFPLNEDNLKILISVPLEFEIYHQQLEATDKVKDIIIGVAYVDLSQMILVEGTNEISGYFHIVKKDQFRENNTLLQIDPSRLSLESLGQIKLTIQAVTSLRRYLNCIPQSQTIMKQYSPLKDQTAKSFVNPFQQQEYMSFAQQTVKSPQYQQQQLNDTQSKFAQSLKMHQHDLNLKESDELKLKLSQKMSQLDELNKQLREGSLSNKNSQDNDEYQEDKQYIRDFAFTRGYKDSQQLQNQLQGFTLPQRNPLEARFGGHPNDIVLEEGSELDREDNVFSNNLSQDEEKNEQEEQKSLQESQIDLNEIQTPKQNYSSNILHSQQEEQPKREEQFQEQSDLLPSRETHQNVFEMGNLSQDQQLQQLKTETKRKPYFDDEEFDLAEMERLDRILKSQKKK